MQGLMSEQPVNPGTMRPPVGNLTDFVEGINATNRLDIEVAIKEGGHVVVFHSHPFTRDVSWFEFDLSTRKLFFILDDGDIRNIGIPLKQEVTKHMQNAHQILMVLMDEKTGEAVKGIYIPLIIHKSEV